MNYFAPILEFVIACLTLLPAAVATVARLINTLRRRMAERQQARADALPASGSPSGISNSDDLDPSTSEPQDSQDPQETQSS